MAQQSADAVIIGVGGAGGILAAELAKAGLRVVGLERGPRLETKDFEARDELRFFQRMDLRPDPKRQPVTYRPNESTRATPVPVINNGNQAGGGTVHYGTMSWRYQDEIFRERSYPLPPVVDDNSCMIFDAAARSLGYHPFPTPKAIATQPYRGRPGCTYCGFWQDFGCHVSA